MYREGLGSSRGHRCAAVSPHPGGSLLPGPVTAGSPTPHRSPRRGGAPGDGPSPQSPARTLQVEGSLAPRPPRSSCALSWLRPSAQHPQEHRAGGRRDRWGRGPRGPVLGHVRGSSVRTGGGGGAGWERWGPRALGCPSSVTGLPGPASFPQDGPTSKGPGGTGGGGGWPGLTVRPRGLQLPGCSIGHGRGGRAGAGVRGLRGRVRGSWNPEHRAQRSRETLKPSQRMALQSWQRSVRPEETERWKCVPGLHGLRPGRGGGGRHRWSRPRRPRPAPPRRPVADGPALTQATAVTLAGGWSRVTVPLSVFNKSSGKPRAAGNSFKGTVIQ